MPIREFTDSSGTRWLVWSTVPTIGLGGVIGAMREGWLTFESSATRKRLIPIPSGWEEANGQRLELMCRAAAAVRRTPSNGFAAVDTEQQRD